MSKTLTQTSSQPAAAFRLPPLMHALTRRIIVLLLTVVALTLASISLLVYWQNQLEMQVENGDAIQMVNKRLALLQESWQREAESITTGLELQRIGSLPDNQRWDRLRAWLVALGPNISFDSVLVQDTQGRALFAHGQEMDVLLALPPSRGARWLFSKQHQVMYAVIRCSIWLGPENGHGEILFFQPLRPSTLQLISSQNRSVYLASDERLLAGSDDVQVPLQTDARFIQGDQRWRMLVVPNNGTRNSHFLVRLPADAPAWFLPVLGGALALGLILALGIYLVLGRWARELVRRIDTLGQAASAFHLGGTQNLATARAILHATDHRSDEIGTVADTLETLMDTVFLREEESRAYLETLNLLEEVVIELDLNGIICRASAAWQRLGGNTRRECDQQRCHLQDFLHPDDKAQIDTMLAALAASEKDQITLRARLQRDDTADAWLECRFVALSNSAGHTSGVRGVLRDITQTYLQERQITQMALHDALTGLPNRMLLEDRAKMAIFTAQRAQHKVGLCFFDLDHFKQINDTLGHKAGDRLLIALSEAMRRRLRVGDTLARWGGDEFVLLIPDLNTLQDLREIVSKISEITHEPLSVDGAEFTISFSMGISVYPDDADNLDSLLSHADRAMFYAKAQGRNTYQFFADMTQKGLGKKELYIQHRLAAAIKNNSIQTWFQPLIDARSGDTLGVEALARWHDSELGDVSPASFIPMAENLGLIQELGEQVWTATLSAGQAWKARGLDLSLAVNISKRQLFMPDFSRKMTEDAARFHIAPQRITLEITESIALLDVEFAAERLHELNHAGFRIAIDDFGTGYSSLSQLHDMPAQELKIVISFIRRIHTPQGLRVVQAIIQMAAAMQMECVAEGVEDAASAELLKQIGVNILQGFHFAKPMPLEEFDAWLASAN